MNFLGFVMIFELIEMKKELNELILIVKIMI